MQKQFATGMLTVFLLCNWIRDIIRELQHVVLRKVESKKLSITIIDGPQTVFYCVVILMLYAEEIG